MATIYSVNLGIIDATDTVVDHLLYTVPLSGGPAIVKCVSLFAEPGAWPTVYAVIGGVAVTIAQVVNTSSSDVTETLECYQPLPPGATIHGIQVFGVAHHWQALVGGYQFNQP